MTSSLEVVDTAVKVGLGAVISAVAAIATAKRAHRHDISKERLRRRADLLEKVAQEVESFTQSLLRYWALLIELVRYRNAGHTMPPDRAALLAHAKTEMWAAFAQLTSAEAKLLLIGEKQAQKAVREFGEAARQWRVKAHPDNLALTEADLTTSRETLMAGRETFFDLLAKAYQSGA